MSCHAIGVSFFPLDFFLRLLRVNNPLKFYTYVQNAPEIYDKKNLLIPMTSIDSKSLFIGPCVVSCDLCGKNRECNINLL